MKRLSKYKLGTIITTLQSAAVPTSYIRSKSVYKLSDTSHSYLQNPQHKVLSDPSDKEIFH